MSIANARTILGFDLDTILTIEVITKRYRELMKQYHPDRHANSSEKELKEYTQKSIDINNAYDYLKQNIDRVNTTAKSKTYDVDDDIIFFMNKSKAISKVRKYFEYAEDSKLKSDVINLYNKCNIENATNNEELKKACDMFFSLISVTYKNEETRYRLANKIPKSFKYDLNYNTDVASFLKRLHGMAKIRENFIDNALDKIISNNLYDEEYSFNKTFVEFRESYKQMLYNSSLTSEEEKEISRQFRTKVKELSSYYEKNRKEYLSLIKKVMKIDSSFITEEERKALIKQIELSIINKNFSSTRITIEKQVSEFSDIKSTVRKLRTNLTIKYKGLLLILNPSKDSKKVNSAINTYDKLMKLLDRAETGEFKAEDLKVLENISFTDENKDKILFSMVTNDLYNIFVSFPKDGVSDRHEPFVLGNIDSDNFISLGSDSVNVKTKEALSEDTLLLPLSVFVRNGNVVNLSRRTKNNKENILCQYGNYELVYSQDLRNNDTYYYLRPSQYRYESYGEKELLLSILENDISDRFLYYTDGMQKGKDVRELKIKTNSEDKE